MDNTQLTHHGIKGMKWGVRRSPAQLGHKTSSKKKKGSSLSERFAAKKKLKAKQKAAEVARKAKQAKEEYEASKKKAIESGTAEDVLKFKGKLTNQELQTAVNRLNMESQLSQLNSKTVKTGMDKVESVANKIDRIRGAAEKGISAWNTFAKIHNSLSPNDLPTLDGNYKDRKAAAAEKAEKKVKEKRDKVIKKIIDSADPEQIAKARDRMNHEERKKALESLKTNANLTKQLGKLDQVSTAETNSESHRYRITKGKEVIDRIREDRL